jgi:hypothetical protein
VRRAPRAGCSSLASPSVVIRTATQADADADTLGRLAILEEKEPLTGSVVLAEVNGVARAASTKRISVRRAAAIVTGRERAFQKPRTGADGCGPRGLLRQDS